MIEIRRPTREDIDKIFFDEEIFDKISDDNCPKKENFIIPYDSFRWFGVYLENNIIGLVMLEPNNYMHFQLLKEYRSKFLNEALEKVFDALEKPIFLEIPALYKNAVLVAKRHQFKENGVSDFIFKKNGISYKVNKYIKY